LLEGVLVKLEGYVDVQTTTNAQGLFSLPPVFGGFTYKLTIAKLGYEFQAKDVSVVDSNINLGDIILQERSFPPRNVVATTVSNNAVITWEEPILGDDVWFSHITSNIPLQGIGTGEATQFTKVQRFTPAQLDAFGITGAILARASFMLAELGISTIQMRIWTGGSAAPFNPGTLIHTQNVPVPTNDGMIGRWIDVDLNQEITIPKTEELWIGFNFNVITGHPLATDSGPMRLGFGNLVFWEGAWYTLNNLGTGLTQNWMIRAMAQGAMGPLTIGNSTPVWNEDISTETANLKLSAKELNNINMTTSSTPPYTGVRVLENYSVYRATVDAEGNPAAENTWVNIDRGVTGLTATDTGWGALDYGDFVYIVKAMFTNNNLSAPAFSNILAWTTDEVEEVVVPLVTNLGVNFPNPFNPSTTIRFDLAKNDYVQIDVFNIRGQRVKTLINEYHEAGRFSVEWNGTDENGRQVGSGVYFYQMRTSDHLETRRMLLMK